MSESAHRDPIELDAPVHQLLQQSADRLVRVAEETDADPEALLRELCRVRDILDPMIENFVVLLRCWGSGWDEISEVTGTPASELDARYGHLDGQLPRSVVTPN